MTRLFLSFLLFSACAQAQVAAPVITLPIFDIRTCEMPNVQKKNLFAEDFRGTTVFAVLIDEKGEVQERKVLVGSGLLYLDKMAATALKLCKPAVPGSVDGQPTAFWIRLRYQWEDGGIQFESGALPLNNYPPAVESLQATKTRLFEATRNGSVEAGMQLAELLDRDKRVTLLRVLARQNHPMAQFDLSEILEQHGDAAERAEAGAWLQRAADGGVMLAKQRLQYKLPAGAIAPRSEQSIVVVLNRHVK
jgi:hypothetical protein